MVGPTVRDGAVVLDESSSVHDLPAGWADEQDGGSYRLRRRDDAALFGWAVDGDRQELLVEAGSERGADLLAEFGTCRPATEDDLQTSTQVTEVAVSRRGRFLETEGIRELLAANLDHPRWSSVAERCLACANCTLVGGHPGRTLRPPASLPEPEDLTMEMRAIHDLLAAHPFFTDLDDGDICYIAGCGANLWLNAGHLLFSEASPANTLYVIRGGKVAIETHAPGQPGVVIDTVGAGGVVGWSWLFPPYRWHFDARVVEDLTAIALDGACLREKCDQDTDLGYRMMQRFARLAGERMQSTRLRLLDVYAVPGERVRGAV